jgi:hypothetical protein
MCDSPTDVRTLVQRDRNVKNAGLALGGTMLAASIVVGLGSGTLDMGHVAPPAAAIAVIAAGSELYAWRANDELRPPLDEETFFEVRESQGKGSGLFALQEIDDGAFLFDYEGEVLNEAAFFERYPQADGRYIACIADDLYIDGCACCFLELCCSPNSSPTLCGQNERAHAHC